MNRIHLVKIRAMHDFGATVATRAFDSLSVALAWGTAEAERQRLKANAADPRNADIHHFDSMTRYLDYQPGADFDALAVEAGWSNGPDAVSNIPNDEGYWMKEGVTEEAGNYRAYLNAREVCEGEGLI